MNDTITYRTWLQQLWSVREELGVVVI
jgi:hypothetical protein